MKSMITPDRREITSSAGLAALISPVDAAGFVADHWERKPMIVRRDDPAFYASLLTLGDVDHILANSGLRESDLRVIVDGQNIWRRKEEDVRGHFAPGTLEEVYGAYRSKGATINLTYLHERWEPLGTLCRELTAELSAEVKSNIYLTPARAQGLKAHYDTHDVFVAQLFGTKRWRLYGTPRALPLQDQRYDWPAEGPGEPVRELELTPGDLLYLPRGVVHDATSTGEASLHLAIGVIPVRWADLIRAAVKRITATDVRFRASVPTRFTHGEWRAAATEEAAALVAELAGQISPETLTAPLMSADAHGRRPVLDRHLIDLEEVRAIDLDTRLRRRDATGSRLGSGGPAVRLEFHGKVVSLPARLAPELKFMSAADPFTGRDLPGDLDEPGRLLLVERLVREGFLTIVGREDGAAADPA